MDFAASFLSLDFQQPLQLIPVLRFLCPCLFLKNGIVISSGMSLDSVGEFEVSQLLSLQCEVPENIHTHPMEGQLKFQAGGTILKSQNFKRKVWGLTGISSGYFLEQHNAVVREIRPLRHMRGCEHPMAPSPPPPPPPAYGPGVHSAF